IFIGGSGPGNDRYGYLFCHAALAFQDQDREDTAGGCLYGPYYGPVAAMDPANAYRTAYRQYQADHTGYTERQFQERYHTVLAESRVADRPGRAGTGRGL